MALLKSQQKTAETMHYPARYHVLEQDELLDASGGGPLEIFDTLTSYTFQNRFLDSVRGTVWNCLLQKSLRPVADWAKNFWKMSLFRKVTFVYGGIRVGQTVVNYWKM